MISDGCNRLIFIAGLNPCNNIGMPRKFPTGFLVHRERGVAVARWYWIDPEYNSPDTLWLAACESREAYDAVRDDISTIRHKGNLAVWQVVSRVGVARRATRRTAADGGPGAGRRRGASQADRPRLARFLPAEGAAVVQAAEGAVPPRRVAARAAGERQDERDSHGRREAAEGAVSALAAGSADRCRRVPARDRPLAAAGAQAALVIEDLNWLLEQVDVSQFLNLIDGIERQDAAGLLLIATTNYPEKLDPAVNNRPGRFDVVIELPNPTKALRGEFFEKNLAKDGEVSPDARGKAAADSDGLSFAHLREVLRLSGLLAIENDREARTDDDLLKAVRLVWEGNDRAVRGFPKPPEVPFGLQHPRRN